MKSIAIALATSLALSTASSILAAMPAAAFNLAQSRVANPLEQPTPVRLLRLAASQNLEGEWTLVQWGPSGKLTEPLAQTQLSLQFSNGRISGSGGCNRFTGTYQPGQGQTLLIGPLAATRKACLPPILSQEDRYLKLLSGEHQYRFTPNGQLELRYRSGQEQGLLVFQSGEPAQATQSWLDQPQPTNWNKAGSAIPKAPRPENSADDFARCQDMVRTATTPEDRALTQAGWKLYGPLQNFGPLTLATGFSGVDGMCRPLQYQAFIFLGGRFAGTLSPLPMDSRTDGAFDQAFLYSDSELRADFRRYTPQDPLCCPSKRKSVSYRISGSPQAPLVVPVQVSTM